MVLPMPLPNLAGSERPASAAPASAPLPRTIGVYVHFPYCSTKCGYCDFLSVPAGPDPIPHQAYADAVITELSWRLPTIGNAPMHSVFFGGGTPSLWEPKQLARVLQQIRQNIPAAAKDLEVTVECNPGSFDARVAEGLLAAGVNRISLGVQALDAERLRFLGRGHDVGQGLEAVAQALDSGFLRVSADLLFGVAGQSPDQAGNEAATVADLGVSHLSAYALTIEPGTRFGELARRGRLALLPEDDVAEAFLRVRGALEHRGFSHYEISNYARPGYESRHNLGYWRGEPYLGLGVGAWGTLRTSNGAVRYRNTASLERYLRLPDTESTAIEASLVGVLEEIGPETELGERLMLGLRLKDGVVPSELEQQTGAPFWTLARRRAFTKWSNRGALASSGERLQLDPSHWLMADAIVRDLI